KAIAVKTFRAGGRQPNTCADVNQGRNAEFLGHAPERLIGGVIEGTVGGWVPGDEKGAEGKVLNGTPRLLHRPLWFLKRDHRNSKQSLSIRRTMLGEPIVIGVK